MFSLCSKPLKTNRASKQVKGGYLLRYKRNVLWNRWHEEWVVLYEDSTMAWFRDPGRSSPVSDCLVSAAPELLAVAQWTQQVPGGKPPLPAGCDVTQLIALGAWPKPAAGKRGGAKVHWMLAKSAREVSEWIEAIAKTLPPAPRIELTLEKPNVIGAPRRPIVRIRPATPGELLQEQAEPDAAVKSPLGAGKSAVAVLRPGGGSLGRQLPWGHGWGWVTLPSGVWSGGLTWSQYDGALALHAIPAPSCSGISALTNMMPAAVDHGAGLYHTTTDTAYSAVHATAAADVGLAATGAEDFDYAMDFGDCFGLF